MTAHRCYRVTCDHRGGGRECGAEFVGATDLVFATRRAAREAGWASAFDWDGKTAGPRPTYDFCPDHAHRAAEFSHVESESRGAVSVTAKTANAIRDLAARTGTSQLEVADRLINAALDEAESD